MGAMTEAYAVALNRTLAQTWRADCGHDEAFLAQCLDGLANLPDCTPGNARAAAEGLRENIDALVSETISRADVLTAAESLEHIADKMHEVAP